jgi:hypothetical protein
MSSTLLRSAAGFALLAVLAAGCGTAAAGHSSTPKPTATAHSAAAQPTAPAHRHQSPPVPATVTAPPSAPTAPSVTAPAQTANPIPQGNGGDQDADNNGGPSDGDGNI